MNVGKAKALKNRVSQYFANLASHTEAVRAVIRREKLYKKEVSANEPQTGKGACARPLER